MDGVCSGEPRGLRIAVAFRGVEMWWFWPFALVIFLATACFGCGVWFGDATQGVNISGGESWRSPRGGRGVCVRHMPRGVAWLLLCCLLFLFYALIRMYQADVYMDAERSFLRFLTPCLLGFKLPGVSTAGSGECSGF